MSRRAGENGPVGGSDQRRAKVPGCVDGLDELLSQLPKPSEYADTTQSYRSHQTNWWQNNPLGGLNQYEPQGW